MPRKKLQKIEERNIKFNEQVDAILDGIKNMLRQKNQSYGNAALDPIRIFSAANPEEQIRVRIDDKLSRIKRGNNSFKEDTVVDLIGYLVLLIIAQQK